MIKIVAAASAAAVLASAAFASEYSFTVQSWELETSAGVQAVLKRIEHRAEQICSVENARSIDGRRAAARCAGEVRADIVAKIDNDALTLAAAASETRVASR